MQSTDNQVAGGIELTPLPYDCRTCGTEQQVYVSPYVIDGERVVDAHNARLHHNYCDECDQERTMVLAVGEQIDAARDGAPVATTRDLHNQRTGGDRPGGRRPRCRPGGRDGDDDGDEQNGWFRLYPWAANDGGQRRQQRDGRRHSSRATLDHAPADDTTDQLSLGEVTA